MYQQSTKKTGSPRTLIQVVVTAVVLLIVASRYFDAINMAEIALAKSAALVESIHRAWIGESKWYMNQGMGSLEKATSDPSSPPDVTNLRAAADSFSKVIDLEPENAEAYFERGFVYSMMGMREAGIADLNKAIAIKDDYAEAYLVRSGLFFVDEKLDACLADLNKTIELDPDYYDAVWSRAKFYEHSGDWDKAITDYTSAIELVPAHLDKVVTFELHGYRGLMYLRNNMLSEAIADLNTFLEAGANAAQLLRYSVVNDLQDELAKLDTNTELHKPLEDLIAKIKSG